MSETLTIIWGADAYTWETKGLRGDPDALRKALYLCGASKPNYPVPAIRETTGKINALNHQAWRWYWYKMGFNYGR